MATPTFNPGFAGTSRRHPGEEYPVGVYFNPENGAKEVVFNTPIAKGNHSSIKAAALASSGWQFLRDLTPEEEDSETYDETQDPETPRERDDALRSENNELRDEIRRLQAQIDAQKSAGSKGKVKQTAKGVVESGNEGGTE